MLCHGHSRHKNDGLDRLSELLNGKGFLTFRFDFRGCGETHINKYRLMCATEWPEDLSNAITFLSAMEETDTERIGAAGISMGASTVVHAAGTDKRIRCAVSMAGVGDCERHLKRVFIAKLGENGYRGLLDMMKEDRVRRVKTGHSSYITAARLGADTGNAEFEYLVENSREAMKCNYNNDFVTLEGVESMHGFKAEAVSENIDVPILYLHGGLDNLVDPSESKSMYGLTASQVKALKILEGIDHNMPMHPERERVFKEVVDWFVLHL